MPGLSPDLTPLFKSTRMTESIAEIQLQLIDLQTQVAFQEDTLTALDDVVTSQQRQIERLTALCERLSRQLDQVASSLPASSEPEVPPHY
jgi:SlyX protein